MTETELSRRIREALQQLGYWVIRTQVKGRSGKRAVATGEPGMPDLYLPGLGHLEVKMPGKKLSDKQCEWHIKASARGVRVATAWSVSEAITIVRSWDREHAA